MRRRLNVVLSSTASHPVDSPNILKDIVYPQESFSHNEYACVPIEYFITDLTRATIISGVANITTGR